MKSTSKLGRPRLLVVGCGDIGMRCIPLLRQRFRVFAMTRDRTHVAALRQAGALALIANLDMRHSLRRIAALAPYILHLAPPPAGGNVDHRTQALLAALGAHRAAVRRRTARARFTAPDVKHARRGRVRLAGHAVAGLAGKLRLPITSHRLDIIPERRARRVLPVIAYGSTSGVYGDCGGALVDETRVPQPANARAVRRISAEQQLRKAGARGALSLSIIRIPGIYAADRLPLERLKAGTPALRSDDDVFTSHIHADDLAAIMCRALWRGRPQRIVHAADDTRLKMGDYFDLVADTHHLPRPPRITREQAEQVLPANLLSFMRESRQLDNTRLKRELRIRLHHPDVAGFLEGRTVGEQTPLK